MASSKRIIFYFFGNPHSNGAKKLFEKVGVSTGLITTVLGGTAFHTNQVRQAQTFAREETRFRLSYNPEQKPD